MAHPHESVRRRLEEREQSLGWRRVAALLGSAVIGAVGAFACTGSHASTVNCAGGSADIYAKQAAASVQWLVYCPTYLPAGFAFDSSQPFGVTPLDDNLSMVTFRNGDQTIEIIQGTILTANPRDDRGNPISTPVKAVMFGDVPSQLFATGQDVPLVRGIFTSDQNLARAIYGSSGLDPDIVVRVAEGMRVVTAP